MSRCGNVEDWAPDLFEKTRVDLVRRAGPRAGPGRAWQGGIEVGVEFGSVVLCPAAAPTGPGCAEAGAELGPCQLKQQQMAQLKKMTLYMVKGEEGGAACCTPLINHPCKPQQ